MFARRKPNRLGRMVADGVRRGNCFFRHLVIVYGNGGQRRLAVRTGGHFLPVVAVDASNLKNRTGDRLSRRRVSLFNRQIGQTFVCCRDGNGTAAVNVRLIDVYADRLIQFRVAFRRTDFHKRIRSSLYICHCNLSGVIGRFRSEQLSVAEDVEYRAGERMVRFVQFEQTRLHFRVVLKNQLNAGILRVNAECFHAGIQRIALRRGDFPRTVGPVGHMLPIDPLQIAGGVGRVFAVIGVVDSLNGDNRSGEALCGIVFIHFADFSVRMRFRRILKHFCDGDFPAVGKDNIFRRGAVDTIAVRRAGFRHGVGTRCEMFQLCRTRRSAGGHVPLKAGAQLLNMERRSGQRNAALRVYLLYDQRIIWRFVRRNGNSADHNALHSICFMSGAATAGKLIEIYLRFAPRFRA